jgi:hypothetical protein
MSDVTPIRDPKIDWLLTPQNAVLALSECRIDGCEWKVKGPGPAKIRVY